MSITLTENNNNNNNNFKIVKLFLVIIIWQAKQFSPLRVFLHSPSRALSLHLRRSLSLHHWPKLAISLSVSGWFSLFASDLQSNTTRSVAHGFFFFFDFQCIDSKWISHYMWILAKICFLWFFSSHHFWLMICVCVYIYTYMNIQLAVPS